MAEQKSIAGEVEGDYGTVKVQLAGAPAGDTVQRPTKGTQVVWGGTAPGSPWAHLAALIEKAGGSVTYTFLHAADLEEPIAVTAEEEDAPAPADEPAQKPPPAPAGSTSSSAGTRRGSGPIRTASTAARGR